MLPLQLKNRKIKKIVILRASRIGDFICATPAFRSVRSIFPEAHISLITLPFLRPLVVRSPCLDRFIPFPGYPGIAEQFFDPRKTLKFLASMQMERFDLAIQMHGTGLYSNPYTLMLGARLSAGFVRPGDDAGRLDIAVPMASSGHETNRLLALTSSLGGADGSQAPEFPLRRSDHRNAAQILDGLTRPLIGIHPYARKKEKCWSPACFLEAALELKRRHGGTVVALGSGPSPYNADRASRDGATQLVDLSGRTSVPTLGAVLSRLSVFITNDSGPAHIAYALRIPTVTIFGETDPQRWGPAVPGPFKVLRGTADCTPCDEGPCTRGYTCLSTISMENVVAGADEVYEREDNDVAEPGGQS